MGLNRLLVKIATSFRVWLPAASAAFMVVCASWVISNWVVAAFRPDGFGIPLWLYHNDQTGSVGANCDRTSLFLGISQFMDATAAVNDEKAHGLKWRETFDLVSLSHPRFLGFKFISGTFSEHRLAQEGFRVTGGERVHIVALPSILAIAAFLVFPIIYFFRLRKRRRFREREKGMNEKRG